MKRQIGLLLIWVAIGLAQTPPVVATVVSVPAAPAVSAVLGKLTATTATVVCTVTGNKVQATAVTIGCTVNSVVIPSYTIPLPASAAYTFQHNFDTDAVTVIIQSDRNGAVTATAAANGITAPGNIPTVF